MDSTPADTTHISHTHTHIHSHTHTPHNKSNDAIYRKKVTTFHDKVKDKYQKQKAVIRIIRPEHQNKDSSPYKDWSRTHANQMRQFKAAASLFDNGLDAK